MAASTILMVLTAASVLVIERLRAPRRRRVLSARRSSELTVRYGERRRARRASTCAVADGEVVCVLGPSGSGKSTLLRAIAGLEPPDRGPVAWDGEDLAAVPPHRRQFGLMFQDHALFPHRDVLGNVAFGLRMQRRRRGRDRRAGARRARTRRARRLRAPARARALGRRAAARRARPGARARARACSCSTSRSARSTASCGSGWRRSCARCSSTLGVTALFVTHDQDEAFALADRVVVMRDGPHRAGRHPAEVWRHPATEFVARFLGFANVVDATVDRDGIHCPWGIGRRGARRATRGSGAVRLAARPDALRIDPDGPVRGRVTRDDVPPRPLPRPASTPSSGRLEVAADRRRPRLGADVGVALDPGRRGACCPRSLALRCPT